MPPPPRSRQRPLVGLPGRPLGIGPRPASLPLAAHRRATRFQTAQPRVGPGAYCAVAQRQSGWFIPSVRRGFESLSRNHSSRLLRIRLEWHQHGLIPRTPLVQLRDPQPPRASARLTGFDSPAWGSSALTRVADEAPRRAELRQIGGDCPGSSMAEREPYKLRVAGSSPVLGTLPTSHLRPRSSVG